MRNLFAKMIAGFAFLMLILALALFGTAGSLRFWQAWVYLAVFAVCTLLITAYLLRYDQQLLASRVRAGPLAETRKRQQILQSFASVFFLCLFIVPGLDARWRWSTMPAWVSVMSNGFVALGFLIVFLVFRENTYTSMTVEVSDTQTVIRSGPYGVVRHPMYAGALLLLLFTPLALGSWVAVPFVLPLLVVIVARLLDEEHFLVDNLRGYAEYREQVAYRLVPLVW